MIQLNNRITPVPESNELDFAQINLVLNKHIERKLQILESKISKLSKE